MIRLKLSCMEICWVTYIHMYQTLLVKRRLKNVLIKLCQPLYGGKDQDILARTYVDCQLGLVLVLLAM